jgi:SPP1 family predicted phage head-tail adaptor
MKLTPDYKTRASARKHRIKILRSQQVNESGYTVDKWVTKRECWASVKPLSATMRDKYQTISVAASHKITISGAIDVLESDKIQFGARRFDIKTVEKPDENSRDKVIITQEIRPGQK